MQPTITEITNTIIDEHTLDFNGVTVVIKSSNPHGFYKIGFPKGRVPENLKGFYTSYVRAEQDVKTHFANTPKSV